MGFLTVVSGMGCWLTWPMSKTWAVTAFALPHLLPLSMAVHEAGHVLAALAAGHHVRTIRVIADRWGFRVDTSAGGGAQKWIAAAGPGSAVAVGIGLTVLGWNVRPQLAAFALPFLAHGVGLLPAVGDGRTMWRRQPVLQTVSGGHA
ncbi:MAG: M50 family metallopeptidase [Longispora sp.]|nr:M50 family metallopeptidase [Longispora sp. (in: high G+C Gram-positive bacteria)]